SHVAPRDLPSFPTRRSSDLFPLRIPCYTLTGNTGVCPFEEGFMPGARRYSGLGPSAADTCATYGRVTVPSGCRVDPEFTMMAFARRRTSGSKRHQTYSMRYMNVSGQVRKVAELRASPEGLG